MIHRLASAGYTIKAICRFLEMPRSTAYYQAQADPRKQELEAAIESIAGRFPTYGRRRVTYELRRAPYQLAANHKCVGQLMVEMGLSIHPRRKACTTNSVHGYPRYYNLINNLPITHPDQVWASDITYIRLKSGFVYLAVILDLYTRAIRGWHLSRSADQQLALVALNRALARHVPEIHHSDQGIQYASEAYVNLLKQHNVLISMSAIGQPVQNGYAERLIRTIKEEEVALAEYQDFVDAHAQIRQFIEDVYMTKRIHSSLGYVTPVEFENAWRNELVEYPLISA